MRRTCGLAVQWRRSPQDCLHGRDVLAPSLTESKSRQGRDATLAELRQQDGACRS